MKKISLFILFFLAITVVYSQCADKSNIYKFDYNNKTYEVVKFISTKGESKILKVFKE